MAKSKKSKILLRRTQLKNIFRSSAFLLVFLFCFAPIRSTHSSPALLAKNVVSVPKQKPVVKIDQSEPARLTIPKIKVNATLESVGLTPQGAVDVPKGPINVAWFNRSVHPGDSGSAVITGHYGYWKNGQLGVFNNLSKLSKGDKIYVKDKQGVTITFVVREFKIYGPKDNVPAVFMDVDGKAHLNLITCLGTWNKVTKSYPKRLVVFTDKE
jgi:LPXTG-site transpeptidase (sortase) family protein